MGNSTTVMSLIAALSAISTSGCIVVKESPEPGCIVRFGPMIGGCSGKSAIVDFTVNTESDCLSISANNCNGGILEVSNSCVDTLMIGGVEVAPSSSMGLDVITAKDGSYQLREEDSNFTQMTHDKNINVALTGMVGSQEVKLAFTKTEKLCE